MLNIAPIDDGSIDAVFDLAFEASADEAQLDFDRMATLVYAAIYTDQRASAERVPEPTARRGWWARPEAGSGVWHVRRQALSKQARNEALTAIQTALEKYQNEADAKRATNFGQAGLTDIVVLDVSPAGSVSLVAIRVTGKHNGRSLSVDLTL